jgi:hypothetical protein
MGLEWGVCQQASIGPGKNHTFVGSYKLLLSQYTCTCASGITTFNSDVVNEFIKKISTGKIKLALALTNCNLIIINTVNKRDEFDVSPDGKRLKTLQGWLACRGTMKTKGQEVETDNDDDDVPPPPNPVNSVAILYADILTKKQEIKPLMTI